MLANSPQYSSSSLQCLPTLCSTHRALYSARCTRLARFCNRFGFFRPDWYSFVVFQSPLGVFHLQDSSNVMVGALLRFVPRSSSLCWDGNALSRSVAFCISSLLCNGFISTLSCLFLFSICWFAGGFLLLFDLKQGHVYGCLVCSVVHSWLSNWWVDLWLVVH